MRISRNPREMARVARKFQAQEDTLEAVRKLLLGTLAAPWLQAAPPDFVADLQEALQAVEAGLEGAQDLGGKLDRTARRAEEQELAAAREFEIGLSTAFDPLLSDVRLLERCRASRVSVELAGLSVGGALPPAVLPGMAGLSEVARRLK